MVALGDNEQGRGSGSTRLAMITASLLLVLLIGSTTAFAYTDTFTPAPFAGTVASFTTGTVLEGLSYVGTNVDFDADGNDLSGLASNSTPPASFVITSRAGGNFTFNNLWIETLQPMVISGTGPEPFSFNVAANFVGVVAPPGGSKIVSSMTVETGAGATDLDLFMDDVSVDFGDTDPPGLTSFARETPATSPTNANTLGFRATFDEDVKNVGTADFAVTGTTASVSGVNVVSASVYDLTVSGGDLAGFNGTVGINLAGGQCLASR